MNEISQKTLRQLEKNGIAPTPKAYFEAFYKIAKYEGLDQVRELNWQQAWLQYFDPSTDSFLYTRLKESRSPDEFVQILAHELKDCKEDCPIEHVQNLKTLSRTLLGLISDIFSIGIKAKFHTLFASGALNANKPSKRLAAQWENFRNHGAHKQVLKKLANITIHALKAKDKDGKMNRQALKLASIIAMHNENLIDVRMLERVECALDIARGVIVEEEFSSCVVVFRVKKLCFFDHTKDFEVEHVAIKSLEILKQICAKALQNASLVGHYRNGFAFLLYSMSKEEILALTNSIASQLQAQKFSYHGALFAFEFEVEVIESYASLEELQTSLQERFLSEQFETICSLSHE